MNTEELAFVLEYCYQRGMDKVVFKRAIDAWWSIKKQAVKP